jgi:dimethylargininase
VDLMPTAIIRDVAPSIVRCELTHLARTPIDVARAVNEHAGYESALRAAGCRVVRARPEPDLPDSVFVEDTAVVLDELAVITRPGALSRRPETASTAEALAPYRPLVAITEPGTLDGGDVLVAGRRIFVGTGGRSNAAGVRQLRDLAAPFGYVVLPVDVRGCLHLKSAATLVSEDCVLVNRAWVDASVFAPLQPIDVDAREPSAANVLRVAGVVLHGAAHVWTRELLERRGIRVTPVPLGELAKAEGAVTCCSVVFRTILSREGDSRT